MGTLGGGNPFIEICLDEAQKVWVMLHSGSRGIGNVIGRYFIEGARREMERTDTHLPAFRIVGDQLPPQLRGENLLVTRKGAIRAGHLMSRTEARKRFSSADVRAQTARVECRKDDAVADEIPGAYKDIDQVMQNQSDPVEVVHTLKQVVCVKG